MAALSKHELTPEEKKQVMSKMLTMGVLAVAVQNIQLSADSYLITEASSDVITGGANIALSSSISGALEFVLNPVLGKLADRYGRKPVYYIGPIISGIFGSLAVIATNGENLQVLMAHRALSWATISMSNSFIGPVTISDMFAGEELAVNLAQLFASYGIAVILAPPLGVAIMENGTPVMVYYVRLALAFYQLYNVHFNVPETLAEDKVRPFCLADCNPFRFVQLFLRSKPLRVLATLLLLNCFAEGKNIVSLMQVWMTGAPLHWSPTMQAAQMVYYGIAAYVAGMHAVPWLIRSTGVRGFTSLANWANTVGFCCMAVPTTPMFWLGQLLHGLGINNTSAAAMKAMAVDHAVAEGFGRGEYGGFYSSLRTFSMIIAPMVFSSAYGAGVRERSTFPTGMAWIVVALTGAIGPELLHRSLSAQEIEIGKRTKGDTGGGDAAKAK